MNKKLILTSLVVLVLLSGLAKAVWEIIFQDNFERSDIDPWTNVCCYRSDSSKSCGDNAGWCGPTRKAIIYNGKLALLSEPLNLSGVWYQLPTKIKDFNWYVEVQSDSSTEIMSFNWLDTEGGAIQIRLNRVNNLVEYKETDIISQYLLEDYPYNYTKSIPYNFGTGSRTWAINITKTGTTVQLYINNVKVFETTSSSEVMAKKILIAGYSPSNNILPFFDNLVFASTTVVKQTPTVELDVYPDYTVTYGTQITVTCTVNPPTLPLHLYYFQTEVSIPYIAVLPIGNNYFRCESEETDQYYSAFDSTIVQVTGVGTTTTTTITIPPHVPPSPIENASKPIPQLVNEEEWRNAGFGWALIFFSPIGLITMFSLIVSAVVARIAGVVFGVVAFMFIWFILVLFTGILPDWLFIVLVIVAAFITANTLRQYVFGGK